MRKRKRPFEKTLKSPIPAKPLPAPPKKGKPILKIAVIAMLVVIGVGAALFFMNPTVKTITGTLYTNPTVNDSKVIISYEFLKGNGLVFADVKFSQKQNNLTYQGRTIWFELYKKGEYLPLIFWIAPSGIVKGAARICEPCSSFSMHIEETLFSKELVCDLCGSRWNLENLAGISGQCAGESVYAPPPIMPTSVVEDRIEIDTSPLGVAVTN